MSAYIVDREHIRYLVAAAAAQDQDHGGSMRWHWNIDREAGTMDAAELGPCDPEGAARVGAMLWRENVASVSFRYERDSVEELPGSGEAPYVYGEHSNSGWMEFHPAQVMKACDCLEYQSCEHPTWPKSEAHAFLTALRHRYSRLVRGYREAPWGAPKADANVFLLSDVLCRRGGGGRR